jgi:hypothetical protein
MPGDEIGVQMGLQNVGDVHAQGAGRGDVPFHVPLGVDHRAAVLAGEKVRAVGDFFDEKLLEQHDILRFFPYPRRATPPKAADEGCADGPPGAGRILD